ncbi:MAG: ORF6N domain-containing protein [Paludibacteraceae bacterium]|nr:ORF6N domain-containing protein [Paludibacteraceae bacterium]
MNDLLLIRQKIYEIRNQRVMLDFELAELYGVETSQLKRAVRRNIERFDGEDFMIVLTKDEIQAIGSRRQFGILNSGHPAQEEAMTARRGENFKYAPFAFTELGVAMLSSVLHSPTAIETNRNIMRAFVELRRLTQMGNASYQQLQQEIKEVKDYIEDILKDQNDINEEHSAQLEAISMALAELQTEKRQQTPREPIGFR